MDDHDQRFKALLREFLPELFSCFFPEWAPKFDFVGTARLIQLQENREVRTMLTMWDIRVMRQVLRRLTEKKFGPLSAEVVRQLDAVPFTELETTLENIVTVDTLAELGLPPAPPPSEDDWPNGNR